MKFAMNVVTSDDSLTVWPLNSASCMTSASKPTNEPSAPPDKPQFQFLSSQFVALMHPESPPKFYPNVGLMNPCADALRTETTLNDVIKMPSNTYPRIDNLGPIRALPQ